MKHPPEAHIPVLARRRIKEGAKAAKRVQERAREQARVLHELAKTHVLVNPQNLATDGSYDTPEFVNRGHYVDLPFNCKSCGVAQVWTETQQKWWFETTKGNVWTTAVLCRPCRRREQARRAIAKEIHFAGIATKARNAP